MAAERGRRRLVRERGPLYYLGLGVSWGLFGLVMLLAAAVVVVPAVSGSKPYTILTSSMEPGLPPGTLVIVKPIDPDDIRIGTIITYQLESGKAAVVTHRVLEIRGPNLPGGDTTYITKGDANSQPDAAPVLPVQIRGAVWYSVPWIGWVNNVVNGDLRAVVIPIVAGVLFLYAGYLVVSSRIDARRRREREEAQARREAERAEAERTALPFEAARPDVERTDPAALFLPRE
ncbi:MAG: signal peptidase I [Actinomycetales bacterium]|nr:signal peptidase I [Actinomycetales bacterium]